ncbi:MAG: PorP/SprF family type IX secretion system membrane protein [Saprospiraceae bacterium]|nr:PorP/SprF family type IX secretion system membrane protein [Saprospiraceae bacterium]MBK9222439.1 PorP/SprF family type IX secretion system membrane protein [Saprospiraceae bacterium]MBK9720526.1 PorP/SprF family type IX secretion system membrane protein [Saprospiraceae bacterium]
MKQTLQKLWIFIILGSFNQLLAQDLHFTQYEFTPIHVNPANTGGFLGTYRIGGVYRDQAASISGFGSDYRTPFLAIDVNFGFAFRPKDWTSLSISFFQDRSGEINLGKGGFLASGAYHLALGKGDLSIGAQFGSVSLNVKNPEKANTFQKISTGASGADEMKLQQAKANYQDIAGGLAYTAPITSSKHVLKVGLSSGHITQPTIGILGSGAAYKLKMLWSAHGSLQYHLNEKTDLIPMVWLRNLEKANETVTQCMLSYLFNVEKKIRLNAGLGYRFGDALQVMVGMDYGKIKAQIGYDQTVSGLTKAQDPSGYGAIELGVSYIGAVTKKPNPKPKIFCPRF